MKIISIYQFVNRHWTKQLTKSTRPSLIKAIFNTFSKEYLTLGIISFFNDVVARLGQPLLLGRLLLYFRLVLTILRMIFIVDTLIIEETFARSEDTTLTYHDAMIFASGIVLLNACNAFLMNEFNFLSYHYGMKVRIAVCSVVYRKVSD